MSSRPHLVPSVAASVLLIVALGQHPYGYYTLLRWAVTVAALVVAWAAWTGWPQLLAWPFVGVAILFNPLAPVYLDRHTWRPIDIACSVAFVVAAGVVKTHTR